MIYSKKNAYAFISKKETLEKYIIFEVGDCFNPDTIERENSCSKDSVKVLKIKDRWLLILYQEKKQSLKMVNSLSSGASIEKEPEYNGITKKRILKKNKSQSIFKKNEDKSQNHSVQKNSSNQGGNTFNFKRVWVDEQLANFEQLLNDARVVPTNKDKKPYFMFQFIKADSIYEKLGLKKNDIILEINGFVVDSVGKALKLLEVLQAESEISLKVERAGKPVEFYYYIN